jgi:hypothetical protein
VPFPRLSLSSGRRSTLSRLVTSADSWRASAGTFLSVFFL